MCKDFYQKYTSFYKKFGRAPFSDEELTNYKMEADAENKIGEQEISDFVLDEISKELQGTVLRSIENIEKKILHATESKIIKVLQRQEEHFRKFDKHIIWTRNFLEKEMKSQDKRLKDLLNVLIKFADMGEDVRDSLGNVLLAINQNEYLQAWYPAQQGYPEMKVTGEHPIVLERKKKERSKKPRKI